ncbi:UNVERIFIED_CONTAM: hypothetical protein HDU68_012139 [Siphonaria sp. JEL0065]|nr:hypothetical protein HDU68_012139 [Siphonaria sp. JEL0065]
MIVSTFTSLLALASTAMAATLSPTVQIADSTGKALSSCAYNPASSLARLEPPLQDKLMLGISLDWSYEVPTASVKKMNGYTPAVFNAWLDMIPGTWGGLGYDNNTFNWFGSEAGKVGSILELSLNPKVDNISSITVQMMTDFSKMCQFINQYYGTPIFLRWAHEMNGDWYGWGNAPSAYIESHRQFTTILRQYTNMTAMVWAPNIGITYPFVGGGARPSPANRTGLDFDVLDSNHDGVINNYDDPYTPFYPGTIFVMCVDKRHQLTSAEFSGDNYVDWVGISLYYYPRCHNNCPVPAKFFDELVTGVGSPDAPSSNLSAWQEVHNFYQMFAVGRNKPMMLPETGSPWIASWANATGATTEVKVKEGWWSQLLSQETLSKYPKLKLFVQFEEVKPLPLDGVPAIQDWRVTNNTNTLTWWNEFVQGFSSNLQDADHLVYACDGSVTIGPKGVKPGATVSSSPTKSSAVRLRSFVLGVLVAATAFIC